MDAELKPCPFCVEKPTVDATGPANHYIVCLKCALSFGPYVHGDQAIAHWNKCAQPEPAEIEKARDRCVELLGRMERRYSPEALSVMMGQGFVVEMVGALSRLSSLQKRKGETK